MVAVSGGGVEIPTALVQRGDLLVRLFNAEGDGAERDGLLRREAIPRARLVELDGRVARRLEIRRANDGRYEVKLAMPRFAVRTLRCRL